MMITSADVLFYYPNVIGYLRILFMVISLAYFLTNPVITLACYMIAFAGDVVDGYVARAFKQTSSFGGILDMVTDRVSTAGFIILLSHIYTPFTLMFVALVILDIASHWFHVLSVSGHHKSKESLEGRIFIMRWFYGIYPFFAYCCVGTEFFYISLYAYHHFPEPWLYTICFHLCLPACIFKQMVNIAQLTSACSTIAQKDADARNRLDVRGLCVPVEEDVRRACEDTGSVEHLRSLLVAYPKLDIAGMHFNLPKREGYTPLTLAARSGHLALVRYLVEEERAAVEDFEFVFFATALHHAARKNKMDIVEYLLAEGADADAETTDANKFTPLMWTASRGHVSTAELLLRSGASLDAEDKQGSTALHWAAAHGNEQIIRFLLSRGADKTAKNYAGLTPIAMYSDRFNNPEVARLLASDVKEEEMKSHIFGGLKPEAGEQEEGKEGTSEYTSLAKLPLRRSTASNWTRTSIAIEPVSLLCLESTITEEEGLLDPKCGSPTKYKNPLFDD